MILEIKSPKWISLGHIQGGGMAALHLEAPGSIGFLVFQHLEATYIPWPQTRGFFHLQSQTHITLTSASVVISLLL